MLSSLSWSKKSFELIIYAFNDQDSEIRGNFTSESTLLDAFQLFFFRSISLSYCTFVKETTSPKTHSRMNMKVDIKNTILAIIKVIVSK